MNFLAHAILSFSNDHVMLGNFIADRVKGNAYNKYPFMIKQGILLHRKIDFYTDNHEINISAKKILKKQYGRYAGVVMDVLYDHYLINAWQNFHTEELNLFIDNFYRVVYENFNRMPDEAARTGKHMIAEDWIRNYKTLQGLENTYKRMSKRIGHHSGFNSEINIIEKHYQELNTLFNKFFPLLLQYGKREFLSIK